MPQRKTLINQDQDLAGLSAVVLPQPSGQHHGGARLTPGGLATRYRRPGTTISSPAGALVITLPVSDAPYLGFQLGSLWYISLDYINHQTSLNGTQAQGSY